MKVEVVNADFQNFRVRRIAEAETLVNLFINDVAVDFPHEFDVKPFNQPPDFGLLFRVGRHQAYLAVNLLQKFGNCVVSGNDVAVKDENRHFAGGVELVQILRRFPWFFFLENKEHSLLSHNNPDLARCRRNRMMNKEYHIFAAFC